MKKILLSFLTTLGLGFGLSAQQNVVKLGLDNWMFGRGDIAYERVITPRQSFQFELGIGIPVSLPGRYTGSFSLNDTTTFALNATDAKWQTWSFTPEYRFYLTDDAPRGLYVAPYAKIKPRTLNIAGSYSRPDSIDAATGAVYTQSANAAIKGGFTTIGVGAQLGWHFVISNRISIDLCPIGFGVDYHTFSVKYTTDDPDVNSNFEDWKSTAEQQLREIPIVGSRFKITNGTDNNGQPYIKGKFGFPFLAYHGNVWIGYAF